jgi:hypothetical protein
MATAWVKDDDCLVIFEITESSEAFHCLQGAKIVRRRWLLSGWVMEKQS